MGDVLKLKDISDATVVMLYMGDELNLQLRPILQKSLKPGSRVVSHRFTMGDWKPLKTITVKDEGGTEYKLHLWKIGEDKPKEEGGEPPGWPRRFGRRGQDPPLAVAGGNECRTFSG